jgi:predicted small secreted protein
MLRTMTDRKRRHSGVPETVKKVVLVLVLLGLVSATLGCNTMRGVGKDISAAGDALSHAAGGTP